MKQPLLVAVALLAGVSIAQAQQAAPAAPPPLAAGVMAPDFTIPGATRYGPLRDPVRLSAFRGKTVALAFFPRARSSGCTVQMQAYRDQYPQLFRGGKDIILIAISTDADTTLAAWAREAQFPFLFGSDLDGSLGRTYGATYPGRNIDARMLYVVDPTGRIGFRATPFREMDPTAYTELGTALDRIAPRDSSAAR